MISLCAGILSYHCCEQVTFRHTMRLLAARFGWVFFVPGNHDLWVKKQDTEKDSMQKLEELVVANGTKTKRLNGLRA